MKAVALTALRQLQVVESPVPAVTEPGDVLLRVEKVGICGSDLHYFKEGRIGARVVEFPFVIGHECSGTVLAIGSGVTRVKVGDQVAVDPAISCYACDQCLAGRPHTCRHLRFLGCPSEAAGCLAEQLVMPEKSLYPVTGKLSLEAAMLCEPLSIGAYAVQLASLEPHLDVAVLGCGPIGLSVLLCARPRSRARFATDLLGSRLKAAQQAGANTTAHAHAPQVEDRFRSAHPGGVDVVFECAGEQETLDQALAWLKPGGKLVIVGIPREARVSFSIDLLRRKEIQVINVRRQNDCIRTAIDLVSQGVIKPEFLITHRFKPEEAQEAFECVADYRDGVLKALIEF